MSKVNASLGQALKRFKQAYESCADKGPSLGAEMSAAQQAVAMTLMEMGFAGPQDAIGPARKSCDALNSLRETFQAQIVAYEEVIAAIDSVVLELTKAIETKNG